MCFSLPMLNLESDEEQPMVFVPGLLCEGNFRHESKVKGRKIQQVKTKLPAAGSVFMSPLTAGDLKPVMSNEIMKEKEVSRSASLKDLCPEDKRRIANLIKELARVSEEKEETVERLKAEQESFEKKIKELEDQNELIMTEREDILLLVLLICISFCKFKMLCAKILTPKACTLQI
uniref:KIAA1328 n=1 Tax=Callorhinchus milii TaxID=7868 RepID=A0A4W3IT00_CALMI